MHRVFTGVFLGRFIPMQPRCRSRLLSARTLSSTYAYLNDQGRARSVNGPLKISTRNKAERALKIFEKYPPYTRRCNKNTPFLYYTVIIGGFKKQTNSSCSSQEFYGYSYSNLDKFDVAVFLNI